MNQIRTDTAFPPLAGLEVLQVCLGRYQAQVHLDADTSILLEGEFVFTASDRSERRVRRSELIGQGLDGLIGTKVQRSFVRASRLEIEFSDGSAISLANDSDAYESFQIRQGSTVVVI